MVDRQGMLRTHWNLCGALIFPTIAEGEITDLRARKLGWCQARSLAGSPRDRGAIYPFGWDDIGDADTVMLTESGEFKTLVPLATYQAGDLSIPTIGCPGINGMPPTLGPALVAKGVRGVILAYDSQPRPVRDGTIQLAPEEIWTLKHGICCWPMRAWRCASGCHSAAPIWPNRSPRSTWTTFVFDMARIVSSNTLMMPRCSMTITRACRRRSCSMHIHHPRPTPPGARAQRIPNSASAAPTERLTLHQARADIRQQVAPVPRPEASGLGASARCRQRLQYDCRIEGLSAR